MRLIDQIDQRLKDWAKTVIEDAEVSFCPPSDTTDRPLVSIYLIDLCRCPPIHGGSGRGPRQISLRYLVTAWAESPTESHHMLGTLVFAAMELSDFEVELDSIPPQLWQAFNLPPYPSFILRAPLVLERDVYPIPRIRSPIEVRDVSMAELVGHLVGRGDIPLVGARVELPSLKLSTSTDNRGRFEFSGVPIEPLNKECIIKAKGRKLAVNLKQPSSKNEPLIIHFDTLEV